MKKLSVLLGLLTGITFALQVPGNGVAEAVVMSMVDADCIFCSDRICPDGMHDAWDVDDDGGLPGGTGSEGSAYGMFTRNGGSHPRDNRCFEGTCWRKHGPACRASAGGTFAIVDMDRLRGSIESRDVQGVKNLLANYTQSTVLNIERSAVQVINCEGAFIAHFPVDPKLLDRVSAE